MTASTLTTRASSCPAAPDHVSRRSSTGRPVPYPPLGRRVRPAHIRASSVLPLLAAGPRRIAQPLAERRHYAPIVRHGSRATRDSDAQLSQPMQPFAAMQSRLSRASDTRFYVLPDAINLLPQWKPSSTSKVTTEPQAPPRFDSPSGESAAPHAPARATVRPRNSPFRFLMDGRSWPQCFLFSLLDRTGGSRS